MGSGLFANATSLLGGRDFANPSHRAQVARILGMPDEAVCGKKGLAYDQIMDAIQDGTIKGLWVVATNSAHSWIPQESAREALKKLEFLVVQDLYATAETAAFAHLLLPAAGWGGKEGTFINSERRLGLVKQIRRAPGQAFSDFRIFQIIAEAWDPGDWRHKWSSPEVAFELLKELPRDLPCDFTGIQGYEMLDACGSIQCPWRWRSFSRHFMTIQSRSPRS